MSTEIIDPTTASVPSQGIRKNAPGKQWKLPKAPFKPGTTTISTTTTTTSSKQSKSYLARQADRLQSSIIKTKEKELKAEKEAIRQQRIQSIKDKRAAKEEKERYDLLAAKMHAKRVERLKRREKRNKLLKER
ncbi:hypothetical protein AOL_s00078g232 [Orbilia oligospora ATCC 24927]|uniref:rRNA-processing protein n=1 Tax=Arthrobotrys oligospora (strain ATCC 24927 / CBS 115.81 / DSM 1491) TaxID=756982 RepID=G1XBD5_ARTOA|nr:hypothetical protein AOL_s00078g232 [Orbilia oligospora ATCC 24927]EGX49743.1 hypothetical protein AOL_s00078g232 [Orbilia oligospora ATCC 24927]